MRPVAMAALAALWFLCCAPALAHKPSDSYLSLTVHGSEVEGQWDIALRDLDFAIGLDRDGNGELTWDEVRTRHGAIAAYALSRLKLASAGAPCPLQVREQLLDDHSDGAYAVLRLYARCPAVASALTIDYRLLFDLDPQHKGLLNLRHGAQASTAIFSTDAASQTLGVAAASRLGQFGDYLRMGVLHIWVGFDHILFLLSLLMPVVLVRSRAGWTTGPSLRAAGLEVLGIVSAFTVAHSITLTLATLRLVALPSRFVESAIAASVAVAALDNVWPLLRTRRTLVAFSFGLIHGFGFASALLDLGLPASILLLALGGFNLGVEVGQLAIVAAFLPLAFWMRASFFYRRVVLSSGSVAIALLALVWLAERVFDFKLLA